jgi:hypothetical protein
VDCWDCDNLENAAMASADNIRSTPIVSFGPFRRMPLVRKGEPTDFTGAGQDLQFDAAGELLGRPFLHQVIRHGKDVILGTV